MAKTAGATAIPWSDLLVRACNREKRDEKAWALLVEHFTPTLESIIRRFRRGDPAFVDYMACEFWAHLYEHALFHFRPRADWSTRAWMCRIASNLVIQFLRARARQASVEALHQELDDVPDNRTGLSLERREEAAEAWEMVNKTCTETERAVLQDSIVNGLTQTEIADRDGVSVSTVNRRINRMLEKLRRLFGNRRYPRT
jgi:RNA polymerase sigma-70 factor (ECF subfamily)